LDKQKNRRLVEILIQECILNTIRSNIPIEEIIRSYMDETTETDVVEKIEEQVVQEKIDLKTLEEKLEEVKQPSPQPDPIIPLEPIIEPPSEVNEVKELIESMKQDSGIFDKLPDVSTPPTSPLSTSHDGGSVNEVASDSDTDSIVFDDDEISLSAFDIEEM